MTGVSPSASETVPSLKFPGSSGRQGRGRGQRHRPSAGARREGRGRWALGTPAPSWRTAGPRPGCPQACGLRPPPSASRRPGLWQSGAPPRRFSSLGPALGVLPEEAFRLPSTHLAGGPVGRVRAAQDSQTLPEVFLGFEAPCPPSARAPAEAPRAAPPAWTAARGRAGAPVPGRKGSQAWEDWGPLWEQVLGLPAAWPCAGQTRGPVRGSCRAPYTQSRGRLHRGPPSP